MSFQTSQIKCWFKPPQIKSCCASYFCRVRNICALSTRFLCFCLLLFLAMRWCNLRFLLSSATLRLSIDLDSRPRLCHSSLKFCFSRVVPYLANLHSLRAFFFSIAISLRFTLVLYSFFPLCCYVFSWCTHPAHTSSRRPWFVALQYCEVCICVRCGALDDHKLNQSSLCTS